jgi:rhamnulokinase
MEAVVEILGRKDIYTMSGVQVMPINTLYQLYALKQEHPRIFSTADTLLLIPDLLNYFLTGEKWAEFTNATTTQLLDPYRRDWHADYLSVLGLPAGILPPLAQPATVLGRLQDRELRELRPLRDAEVVHTASHDTAAAVISIPHGDEPYAYISSGTWSLVGTVVPSAVISPEAGAFNFGNEGGLGNFRLLRNVMGLWLVQETQQCLRSQGKSCDIETLIRNAGLAPAFEFVFDPDDPRLLQFGDIPGLIRQICRETGQEPPQDTGSLLRGILESLALKYRLVLEQLESLTGVGYQSLHIVGGGSQNKLLSQFTANSTRKRVVAGPVEASALGNALTQLLAIGELGSVADVREIAARSVQTTIYEPVDQTGWDAAYERFLRISAQQAERIKDH